jgi:hypothetical protein
VRLAYLDEAGIGNSTSEPFTVVAGVLVAPDDEWFEVQEAIASVGRALVMESDRKDLIFHAKDLFHGSGVFKRDRYSKEDRWEILTQLASIPKDFGLPVVWGAVDRVELAKEFPDFPPSKLAIHAQGIASMRCTLAVEKYMRENTAPKELATVVYENNPQAKQFVKQMHNRLNDPNYLTLDDRLNGNAWGRYTPFRRVIDTAHFVEKSEAKMLQLADLCAFVIKRRMMGKADSVPLMESIEKLLSHPPEKGWPKILTGHS